MSIVRDVLRATLDWAPVPLRVTTTLMLLVFALVVLCPLAARMAGKVMGSASGPFIALLTYPEYLTTSLCRRLDLPLLPGTYAYGSLLGGFASATTAAGHWLERVFARRLKFPWKPVLGVGAVLTVAWNVTPFLPAGGAQSTVVSLNKRIETVDSWLISGSSSPLARSVPSCRPTTPVKSPAPKKKPGP